MPLADPAPKIQNNNVPFLTCPAGVAFGGGLSTGMVTAMQVRGYIAGIEGYLWSKNDGTSGAFRVRLDAVKNDVGYKFWLNGRSDGVLDFVPVAVATLGGGILASLRSLDHVAYDIKAVANHDYRATPVTANVARLLTRTTAADRVKLANVIAMWTVSSCANNEAPIQTLFNLPPPETTFRIDRENLSAGPAQRFWTYRLQNGGATNGGLVLETGFEFSVTALRAEWMTSLTSVATLGNGVATNPMAGNYIQCSAPQWLRDIVAAP